MGRRYCFILSLWFVFMVRTSLSNEHCPAVEEGSRYTIDCKGVTSRIYRTISWSADSKEVSSCYDEDELCTNRKNGYSSSQYLNGLEFNNTLIIDKVTPAEREMELSCTVLDVLGALETETVDTVRNCTMNVYIAPDNVNCDARITEKSVGVNVTCHTSKVYPGIKCKFFENSSASELHVKPSYNRTPFETDSIEYFQASCTTLIEPKQLGRVQWKVEVYPGWENMEVTSEIQTKTTNSIDLKSDPLVTISPAFKNDDCSNSVQCQGKWFPSEPIIRWYIDGDEVTGPSPKIEGTEYKTFVSVLDLDSHNSSYGKDKLVMCEAYMNNNNNKYSDSKPLIWPPIYPPVFKYKDKVVLKNSLELSGDVDSTLFCEVKGGNPKVNATSVKCFERNEEKAWFQKTSPGQEMMFQVKGNLTSQNHRCICSANHLTSCYSLTTTIDISLVNRTIRNLAQTAISSPPTKDSSTMYYIIGGVCGFVILVLAVLALVCLHKHWDVLYATISSRSSRGSPDHHYESVGNVNHPNSPDEETQLKTFDPYDLSDDEKEGHFPTPHSSPTNSERSGYPGARPTAPVNDPPHLPNRQGERSSLISQGTKNSSAQDDCPRAIHNDIDSGSQHSICQGGIHQSDEYITPRTPPPHYQRMKYAKTLDNQDIYVDIQ